MKLISVKYWNKEESKEKGLYVYNGKVYTVIHVIKNFERQ